MSGPSARVEEPAPEGWLASLGFTVLDGACRWTLVTAGTGLLAVLLAGCVRAKPEGAPAGSDPESAPLESGPDVENADPDGDSALMAGCDFPEWPMRVGAISLPHWVCVPPDPEWQPGDAVPGWEDYPCPDTPGPDVLTLEFPDPYMVLYGTAWPEAQHLFLSGLQVTLADCTYGCSGTYGPGASTPGLSFVATSQTKLGYFYHPDRGQGVWDPERGYTRRADYFSAYARTPFGQFQQNSSWWVPDTAAVTMCLRRVRPDQIVGAVDLVKESEHGFLEQSPYPGATIRVTFDQVVGAHWGMEYPPEEYGFSNRAGEGPAYAAFIYNQSSYIDSWPWEEITDPHIRSALFWKYTPFNDEACQIAAERLGMTEWT